MTDERAEEKFWKNPGGLIPAGWEKVVRSVAKELFKTPKAQRFFYTASIRLLFGQPMEDVRELVEEIEREFRTSPETLKSLPVPRSRKELAEEALRAKGAKCRTGQQSRKGRLSARAGGD